MNGLPQRTALIVGASRGLGLGLAEQFLKRGWRVIGTVRDRNVRTGLHDLAAVYRSAEIEEVDVNRQDQVAALRERLSGQRIDLLFFNSAIANGAGDRVTNVSTDDFNQMMVTNVLSPMRFVETFVSLVPPNGTVGVMSSNLASVTDNTVGEWEVYRGSKAALNTLMRSFAARHPVKTQTLLLIAPGWVRTDMGGADADIDVETSVKGVADVIEQSSGKGGLHFLHYTGRTVNW